MKDEIIEFLKQSNYIEMVSDPKALDDAIVAWKFLESTNSLSLENILHTHKLLMKNLNKRIAGNLRNCNVRVGYRICPDHTIVFGLLSEWLRLHADAKTEEEIKLAHVVFESIHPFEDGNGRIGRIIMNWQRIKNNLPILVIQEEEKFDYYQWFK